MDKIIFYRIFYPTPNGSYANRSPFKSMERAIQWGRNHLLIRPFQVIKDEDNEQTIVHIEE